MGNQSSPKELSTKLEVFDRLEKPSMCQEGRTTKLEKIVEELRLNMEVDEQILFLACNIIAFFFCRQVHDS